MLPSLYGGSMSLFIETLIIVLPVFLVIGLGTVLRQLKLLDESFIYQTNQLVYMVFLPLLLFYKIGKADFFSFFNARLVIGSSLVILLGFLVSYAYGLVRRYPPPVLGSFSQGSFRGNLAYVGLAICLNAYGEDGLTSAGVLMGFFFRFVAKSVDLNDYVNPMAGKITPYTAVFIFSFDMPKHEACFFRISVNRENKKPAG